MSISYIHSSAFEFNCNLTGSDQLEANYRLESNNVGYNLKILKFELLEDCNYAALCNEKH